MLTRLAALRGHVDAINLADNALGRVKLAPLVFGSMIKSRLGMPVVINFSCRDRNRYALKADLLGAGALGIDARGGAGRRQARRRSRRRAAGPRPRPVQPAQRDERSAPRRHRRGTPPAQDASAVRDRRGRQSQSQDPRARARVARAQGAGRRRVRDHAAGFRPCGGARLHRPRAPATSSASCSASCRSSASRWPVI